MRILAFESSAKAASVALMADGRLLAEAFQNTGLTHSRTLLSMAEDLLKTCELTVKDVDAVAVAKGPGSFTGLRIGVAAAKGFAWGRQIPVVGVSTLEGMARNAGLFTGTIVACMDARRQQVYNALFSAKDGAITRLTEDRAISLDDLWQELSSLEGTILLLGDGAELCNKAYEGRGKEILLAPEHFRHQRATGIALLAGEQLLAGLTEDNFELAPNYLRLSQAERERAEKLKEKGEV